jgi:hypothetical protein
MLPKRCYVLDRPGLFRSIAASGLDEWKFGRSGTARLSERQILAVTFQGRTRGAARDKRTWDRVEDSGGLVVILTLGKVRYVEVLPVITLCEGAQDIEDIDLIIPSHAVHNPSQQLGQQYNYGIRYLTVQR